MINERMNQFLACLSVLIWTVVIGSCATKESPPPSIPQLKIIAEVSAEPHQAMISYKGREVGTTPVTVNIGSFSELVEIAATHKEMEVIEMRCRILSSGKAQVVFHFGAEPSPLVKALGLSKVLIFDYGEQITFDIDRADLKPELLPILTNQAKLLNTYFGAITIYVCGHTDYTGGKDHNLTLSLQRAKAVSDFLTANGVDRRRVRTQGFGEDYPTASNATTEGRALNRRTEVILPQ